MKLSDFVNNMSKLSGLANLKQYDGIINIEKKIYNVKLYEPDIEPKSDCAYILGKYILPFRHNSSEVGITSDKVITLPTSKEDKLKYSIDKLIILNPEEMYKNLNLDTTKNLITTEVNEVTHYNINDDDSVLMKIIKQAINSKNININNYKDRFTHQDFTNSIKPFKENNKNLSIYLFLRLCEKLDIEWHITCKDKPNCQFPMNKVIEISSDYFE